MFNISIIEVIIVRLHLKSLSLYRELEKYSVIDDFVLQDQKWSAEADI